MSNERFIRVRSRSQQKRGETGLKLAIDVGNSNAVIGVYEEGCSGLPELLGMWRLSTHPVPTADELLVSLDSLMRLRGMTWDRVQSVVLASVVPRYTETVQRLCAGHGTWLAGVPLRCIDSRTPFSFQMGVDSPEKVGADRLVNAEAAVRAYGAPVVVLDCGTATTLTVVDAQKKFVGGAIMAGFEMSVAALARGTAQLPRVGFQVPHSVIGKNTEAALHSGAVWGYASMVDGMIQRVKQEMDVAVTVVGTGGLIRNMSPLLKAVDACDEHLTLKGLMALG